MTPLLNLKAISKAFPGVIANDAIDLTIAPGQAHALLGENGAGKSTLVKIIYGLQAADAGVMLWNGTPYLPQTPKDARATGIGMVFQHFSLFPAMSVSENIALGLDGQRNDASLRARIDAMSRRYGLALEPDARIADLSVGERQRVEVVRALLQSPALLIMDEPTSVLTPSETATLFATLRQLRAEGMAILYISHKLEEVRDLCEAATVLRHGRVTGQADPRTKSAAELAEMMVGQASSPPPPRQRKAGSVLLSVLSLAVPAGSAGAVGLSDVTFAVGAGEILGVAGVAGNGQDALFAALSGECRSAPSSIMLEGVKIGGMGPRERRECGIFAVPESRLGHAAAPEMSLTENTLITTARNAGLIRAGWIQHRAARDRAAAIIEAFDVRTPGPGTAAKALSGGNLQKFVVGREIMAAPRVLIVNQPTWGVDVAAADRIRHAIIELAETGAAIIVISQDLDEIIAMADRFAALVAGRLSPPEPIDGLSREAMGLRIGGAEAEA